MPRHPRRQSTTGYYHITNRGVGKSRIFKNERDREHFIECLSLAHGVCEFSVLAYCIMTTHFHLVIKCDGPVPPQLFQSIGARFCYRYNARNNHVGHIFQGRFYSEAIESESHLLSAIRYVWRNPVAAHMCDDPSEYRWSSFGLIGRESPLIDADLLYSLMSAQEWREFAMQESPDRHIEPFSLRIPDDRAGNIVREVIGRAGSVMKRGREDIAVLRDVVRKCMAEGLSIPQIARELDEDRAFLRSLFAGSTPPVRLRCSILSLASP